MTIQDVANYHDETVAAIAHLQDVGVPVPPEAIEIKELTEFAIEQYKMLQEKEEVVVELTRANRDLRDRIDDMNMYRAGATEY